MAAALAAKGFEGSPRTIEGSRGFAAVFSDAANLNAVTDRLGDEYALMSLTFKPYPCGIVIHPAIDGCLELIEKHRIKASDVERVELVVDPLCLELTGNQPAPKDPMEAQVSIHHWTAATIARGRATLEESEIECTSDPFVGALRRRVVATPDPRIRRDEAIVTLKLKDGRSVKTHIEHCRGSADRPMTDADTEQKFRDCTARLLPEVKRDQLIRSCWNIDRVENMAAFAS